MSRRQVLVCTVGGSDVPIVTALRAVPWDHVVFVCTDSSLQMLTAQIEIGGHDGRPPIRRSSIPEQASLGPELWSSLLVPADDPDGVFTALIAELDQLRDGSSPIDITVDFTGGTKSMSAGAVLAVASRPGVRLQVTSGQRTDLVRVVDGTQRAIALGTQRIAMDRQILLLRETWSRFGYQEAAEGFDALLTAAKREPSNFDGETVARLKFWAGLGRGFAAWDRFDRGQAVHGLRVPLRTADQHLKPFGALAEALRAADPTPLVLFDLLRNAQRCVARGRYDDAVARCYRLWEWTAQWLLTRESGIATDDVDSGRVPPGFLQGLEPKTNGRFKIASAKAWALYRFLHPDNEATLFWNATDTGGKTNQRRYEELGQIRNSSILAHGSRPIGLADAERIMDWTAVPFMDMVRTVARRHGEADDMPQLPSELPLPFRHTSPRQAC